MPKIEITNPSCQMVNVYFLEILVPDFLCKVYFCKSISFVIFCLLYKGVASKRLQGKICRGWGEGIIHRGVVRAKFIGVW